MQYRKLIIWGEGLKYFLAVFTNTATAILLLASLHIHASIPEGYTWLSAQQIVGNNSSQTIAGQSQAISESIVALLQQDALTIDRMGAVAKINTTEYGDLETLVRYIIASRKAGLGFQANIDTLLDCGWGEWGVANYRHLCDFSSIDFDNSFIGEYLCGYPDDCRLQYICNQN